METILEKQLRLRDEYINLLEKEIKYLVPFLDAHGINSTQIIIHKAKIYKEQIKEVDKYPYK